MVHHTKYINAKSGHNSGFSLLEIVLVVAIIAIIATIAAPRFGAAQIRYRADLAAQRIAADLAYLQTLTRQGALVGNAVFEINDDQYVLEQIPDMDRPEQEYQVDLSDPQYGADLVSATFENVNGYASTSSMRFDMWGRPQCGNPGSGYPMAPLVSGSIVLQVGSEIRTITVDPVTGRASIP